jgi:hypothetical protein
VTISATSSTGTISRYRSVNTVNGERVTTLTFSKIALTPESADAKGWRRLYRGTGQTRQVKHSVVLDLTPEQWSWLTRAAGGRDAVLHDFLSALIEEARLTDEAAEGHATAEHASR